MVRARGNARKKKTRLTEESLSAVMEVARPRVAATETAQGVTEEATRDGSVSEVSSSASDSVVSSILELLRAEPDVAVMPAAYNDPSRAFSGAADYPAQRYLFGLAVCPECRHENMYYQDRDVLAAGYHFRCRICQHELRATPPQGLPG